ncbi:DUF7882 family protein [Leifsonia sp. 2MCAF36]|uniref:DUF7882 family protein n=1 Tax=Leifsonia sp. 2MCAF36 TaxID=3232988 RepID=UPI003F9B7520
MGSLRYGSVTVEFDDRVLTHLQIVIVNKLRRRESFAMSWRDSNAVGDGRSAIWIDPTIPLYFKFDGSRVPEIDRGWLAELSASADSSMGLVVNGPEGEDVTALPDVRVIAGPAKAGQPARQGRVH